jgi:predicted PurR-regulated permease PerM
VTGSRPAIFWLSLAVVGIFLIYLLKNVLLPFAAGALVAYFLAPVVAALERRGVPRWVGTTLALLLFLAGMVAILMLVVPPLSAQVKAFIAHVPDIIATLQRRFSEWLPAIEHQLGGSIDELKSSASSAAGDVAGFLVKVVGGVVASGFVIINAVSLLVIMPVVAFYILRDWPAIVRTIDGYLPRPIEPTVSELASEIDRIVAAFIRGVGMVCLSLAIYYAVALSLVGLQFGLALGIFAGLAAFIPMFGAILSFILALALALGQFETWTPIGLVVLVFAVGQILEGYVFTPQFVGNRVGLHPVWVIFALMAGGALFGFLGLLLAVPAAAAIGVLIRFAIARYRASPYFQGAIEP